MGTRGMRSILTDSDGATTSAIAMAGDRCAHKFPETCDTETPNLFNLTMKNRPFATPISLIVLLFSLPLGTRDEDGRYQDNVATMSRSTLLLNIAMSRHYCESSLLSGTLKTYQRAACDEETMTLKCPPGTTILVEHAQYGRTGMHGISKCNSSVPLMIAGDKSTNHTCIWPQSVQHSLLQMVVGVCQKKRQCKFNTDPKTFQGDPCPGLRKYIEVAYKCRPYEFRSKVACENEVVNLVCHPGQRVAIFSAAFGRTQYESLQCPQPLGVQEESKYHH
ncbi:Uncharacterized protein C21orf63 like protein [Atta colombica]|uniref:Uncharacterized protein C21orf63 like protein n=1 Tax=Atta colombica TaxID=520822 RepID=A0A195BFQ1_9HYME|nr:Uncharacterized protein C21orf63 like protein [Atta colombica]